jgi:hypothetical protein
MSLQSDVTVNFAKFDPKNVAEDTKKFSDMLVKLDGQNPNWWDVSLPIPPFDHSSPPPKVH